MQLAIKASNPKSYPKAAPLGRQEAPDTVPQAANSRDIWGYGLLKVLWQEMLPYDGRMAASLRMAAACVLTVAVAMSQQIPEAALACYLIFFASKKNAGAGIVIAAGLIVAATVGIGLGILFLEIAADDPMVRVGLLAVFTFGGMFFSQASKLGPMAATVGFVFAFVMTLNDIVPVPELLSRALAWMWLVVFVPMSALIIINIVAGPNPAKLLRNNISVRLQTAAALLQGDPDAMDKARILLRTGLVELESLGRTGRLIGFLSGSEAQRLNAIALESHKLLSLMLVQSKQHHDHAVYAKVLADLAGRVEAGQIMSAQAYLPVGGGRRTEIALAVSGILDAAGGVLQRKSVAHEEEGGFLRTDAFTNPAYVRFALKALLAVLITYVIYTGWDWFDIHTAMITVFYVSLGTAGETLHKATLRIIGCLIGAVMGVGSMLFLMPHMTDIGQLMLLVAGGSFIAAWVSNGSERVQYMGWQMALAFFLCVLKGYGPSFDTSVATSRVIGILIGNIVVAAVFLNLWPVSVSEKLSETLRAALAVLKKSVHHGHGKPETVAPLVDEARRLEKLSHFEPMQLNGNMTVAQNLSALADNIDHAADIMQRLQVVRTSPHYFAGVSRRVRTATQAYEMAVTQFLDAASSAIVPKNGVSVALLRELVAAADHKLARLRRVTCNEIQIGTSKMRDVQNTMPVYEELQKALSGIMLSMECEKAVA